MKPVHRAQWHVAMRVPSKNYCTGGSGLVEKGVFGLAFTNVKMRKHKFNYVLLYLVSKIYKEQTGILMCVGNFPVMFKK